MTNSQRQSTRKTEKAVFVVDDDPSILRALKRLFKKHGLHAVLFSSAEQLRAHDNFEKALCIVLDVDLGTQSGIALHQELVTAGVTVPVIFMSGKEASRAATVGTGCVAYLEKPFSTEALIEPIQRLLA